jgi:hypothetical protein
LRSAGDGTGARNLLPGYLDADRSVAHSRSSAPQSQNAVDASPDHLQGGVLGQAEVAEGVEDIGERLDEAEALIEPTIGQQASIARELVG